MKKQPVGILLAVTLIFSAFCLGFFLGRNQPSAPVQVSGVSTAPRAEAQTETTQPETTVPTEPPVQFPVNINSANQRELEALPGIGEVLAARILAYRTEHGRFAAVEELMLVEGIGEGKLEDMLEFITTGG